MKATKGILGSSVVEMMIVATVFVLVATTIYRTLTNLTQLKGAADSAVALQIEGQKGLDSICEDLRTSGFFRPLSDNTLVTYNSSLWTADVTTDPHAAFDVPYLWPSEGSALGIFATLAHPATKHDALSTDEEFGATREISFIRLTSYVPSGAAIPSAGVTWSSGMLGATATIVMPVKWELISFELQTDPDNVNRLKRVVREIDAASLTVGAITDTTTIASYVEAARFDTAQTDASLALYTVKATLWLRKQTPSGQTIEAKVQTRVKLRNSVK
jgi:hypothetical protein